MALFRRNKRPPDNAPATRTIAVPDTDWADQEAVLAEWRHDSEPADWGGAMQLFDNGPVPAQRLNVAEYFTRRLKLALFDPTALPDDLTAEVCRRVLVLLSSVPSEPAWIAKSHAEFGPRLTRLPLSIMRARGWQPVQYGGNGAVSVDLTPAPIVAAVATTRATDGRYMEHFFGQS